MARLETEEKIVSEEFIAEDVLRQINELGQVRAAFWVTNLILDFRRGAIESPVEQLFFAWWKHLRVENHHALIPQYAIKSYFVDFLIEGTNLVIEIDGHWHEKTKAQVKKDRQRERAITRAGYQVIRFTGSEVHSNPSKCIGEAIQMIMQQREGK